MLRSCCDLNQLVVVCFVSNGFELSNCPIAGLICREVLHKSHVESDFTELTSCDGRF